MNVMFCRQGKGLFVSYLVFRNYGSLGNWINSISLYYILALQMHKVGFVKELNPNTSDLLNALKPISNKPLQL